LQARLGDDLVLDPCAAEQKQQRAGATVALMPTANLVRNIS